MWDLDVCSNFCLCGTPDYTPYVSPTAIIRGSYNDCPCAYILSKQSPYQKWIDENKELQHSPLQPGDPILPLTAANVSLLQKYDLIGEGGIAKFLFVSGRDEVPYKLIPEGSP